MTKMIRRGQYTRNVSEEIAPPIKENTRGKKIISQDYSTTSILRKRLSQQPSVKFTCTSPLFLNSIYYRH